MKLLSIMKKEFHRFFHDPKLIVTMIMPGILIYLIYSLMGTIIWEEEKKEYDYRAYLSGQSQMVALFNGFLGEDWSFLPAEDLEAAQKEVEAGKADALLVFPEGFDEAVAAYTPASGTPAPCVMIYCNTQNASSAKFSTLVSSVLAAYEEALSNKFDVTVSDYTEEADVFGSMLGMLIPFLVVIFIFAACMSVTLESVAGEKERGTLATILITSVKRRDIALGKVLALSCIISIGATSSFLGVLLSLPKLLGVSLSGFVTGMSFWEYLLLFLLILSIVPLIVSAVTVLSTYAKTVKEASAYTSVIMILTMVVSLVSAFVSGIGDWAVAIPVFNAVVFMQRILSGTAAVLPALLAFGANLVYTGLILFGISKMLSSERVMFGS